MLNIKRVTDCNVLLECEVGNGKTAAIIWREGAMDLQLASGGSSIRLTKSQLLQLAEVTPQIAADLVPELPKPEKE